MGTLALIYALSTCVSLLSHQMTAVLEQPPVAIQQSIVVMAPSPTGAPSATADVYPSERAAVEAMTNHFVNQMRTTPNFNERETRIYVGELLGEPPDRSIESSTMNMSGNVTSVQSGKDVEKAATKAAIQIAVTQLQLRMKNARSSKRTFTRDLPENESAIGIHLMRVKKIERGAPVRGTGYVGRVKGVLLRSGQEEWFEADFVSKRWVDDVNYFMNQQTRREWAIGRSSEMCRSEAEADQQARRAVGVQILRILESRGLASGSADYMIERISQQLLVQRPADRFVQRVRANDENFVNVSILVPTTDENLQSLLPEIPILSQRASPASARFSSVGSIIIMTVVIVFLYLVLNGVTRGYYSSMLRIGVVVLLILGGLLFMLVGARVAFAPSARTVITR